MIVEEAEKLICPFMSNVISTIDNQQGCYEVTCITTNCMAWKTTEIHKRNKQGNKVRNLSESECEGYCIRLKE